ADIVFASVAWIAITSSTGGEKCDAVARVQRNLRFLPDGSLFTIRPRDDCLIDCAVQPAVQPPGRVRQPFKIDIRPAFHEAAIGEHHAQSAAMTPRTAAVGTQRMLFNNEWIFDFLQLD